MLDVHPPEHTPHTWRDFLIHIATIVVGLVIAIGLEQSVEWVHHRQERHQLLEDIRGEGTSNAAICRQLVALNEANEAAYAALADAVRTAPVVAGHVTIVIPALVRQKEAALVKVEANVHGALLPTTPVWDTATQTQATALLTPESNRFFADLPYDLRWINFFAQNMTVSAANYNSIVRSLTGQMPPIVAPAQNTLIVTPEQRDRLLDAISKVQENFDSLDGQAQFYERRSRAVADGVQSTEQATQWDARHGHPTHP